MRGPIRRIVVSSALLLLLTGCQGGTSSGAAASASHCTSENVRQIVERFIGAFNRGDLPQLDQLFARLGEGFHWYSTDAPGQRFNAEASNRDTLMAYFAARHLQHERLVLNSLDVTYTTDMEAGFWFRVMRSADDGLSPTAYNGKGGVQCMFTPSSLSVWAMDPLPWSPLELLPEAATLILLGAAAVAVVLWRRRTARHQAPTDLGG
jgi:hypothetical protein